MIVVDVETTGLDERRHSIVSIGAVELYKPNNQFSIDCCIWDGAEISKEALEINGFTEEQVRDPSKLTPGHAVICFIGWAKRCEEWTLAGENPSFDSKFLKATLDRYNAMKLVDMIMRENPSLSDVNCDPGFAKIPWPFGYRTYDIHTACLDHYIRRGLVPPVKNHRTAISLDTALEYVGLPPEPRPHLALNGAKLEAEVICRLRHGIWMFDEYRQYPIPAGMPSDYVRFK